MKSPGVSSNPPLVGLTSATAVLTAPGTAPLALLALLALATLLVAVGLVASTPPPRGL